MCFDSRTGRGVQQIDRVGNLLGWGGIVCTSAGIGACTEGRAWRRANSRALVSRLRVWARGCGRQLLSVSGPPPRARATMDRVGPGPRCEHVARRDSRASTGEGGRDVRGPATVPIATTTSVSHQRTPLEQTFAKFSLSLSKISVVCCRRVPPIPSLLQPISRPLLPEHWPMSVGQWAERIAGLRPVCV